MTGEGVHREQRGQGEYDASLGHDAEVIKGPLEPDPTSSTLRTTGKNLHAGFGSKERPFPALAVVQSLEAVCVPRFHERRFERGRGTPTGVALNEFRVSASEMGDVELRFAKLVAKERGQDRDRGSIVHRMRRARLVPLARTERLCHPVCRTHLRTAPFPHCNRIVAVVALESRTWTRYGRQSRTTTPVSLPRFRRARFVRDFPDGQQPRSLPPSLPG